MADGLSLCPTAGDDGLQARNSEACLEATAVRGVILGIFDTASQRVWVTVRSPDGYGVSLPAGSKSAGV